VAAVAAVVGARLAVVAVAVVRRVAAVILAAGGNHELASDNEFDCGG
jgi:hypothetical protein